MSQHQCVFPACWHRRLLITATRSISVPTSARWALFCDNCWLCCARTWSRGTWARCKSEKAPWRGTSLREACLESRSQTETRLCWSWSRSKHFCLGRCVNWYLVLQRTLTYVSFLLERFRPRLSFFGATVHSGLITASEVTQTRYGGLLLCFSFARTWNPKPLEVYNRRLFHRHLAYFFFLIVLYL